MFSEAYQIQVQAIKDSVFKEVFTSTGEKLEKSVLQYFRFGEIEPSDPVANKYPIEKFTVEECSCFHYVNKNAKKTVLYLHGGGFFIDIMEMHWLYAGDLYDAANVDIYMPQYPVIPESNCEPCFRMLVTLYKQLLEEKSPEDIIVMGDSAGGGIALAFAMLLKEQKLPQPKEIILISPCLKLAPYTEEEKEEAERLDAIDPMISYQCMEDVRRLWGGNRAKDDYLVNPFYGDLNGLAKMTMFSGTADILYLYNREFYEKAQKEGISIDFYVREGLIHDYIMLPVVESEEDRKIIVDTVLR